MYAIGYVMGGDKRVDLYSELAEKMEELNGRASKSLELPSERIPEWRSELKKEIQSCVETRLQQEGYETPEEFVRKVRSKIAHEYIQEGYKMIWDAVADDENPADRERWNVEEHITREQVRRVVEENSLYIGYRIRNRMRTDLDELLSFSRRDITAGEVLVSVPTDGGEVGEIAQDVSNHTEKGERQTIPVVAKLSRFMSCEEDPQLGQWRGNKIVSLNRDADRMDDWVVEPTEYGKLLKSNVKLRTVKSAKKREGSIFDSRYLFAALDVPDEILRNPDERFDL